MENAKKLDDYLYTIPYKQYFEVMGKLATHCGVTTDVIYNWRTGRTFLSKTNRDAIEAFFDKKIF